MSESGSPWFTLPKMDDLNYMVLFPDGKVDVLHIGDADEDEIFLTMLSVFKTPLGGFFDSYKTRTMSAFTANDVSMIVNSDDSDDGVKKFFSALNGKGFELSACWHKNDLVHHRSGFYEENRFFHGKGYERMFGPVIIRARIDQDNTVEVPASTAVVVAELIVKAKGMSLDCIFTGQTSLGKKS